MPQWKRSSHQRNRWCSPVFFPRVTTHRPIYRHLQGILLVAPHEGNYTREGRSPLETSHNIKEPNFNMGSRDSQTVYGGQGLLSGGNLTYKCSASFRTSASGAIIHTLRHRSVEVRTFEWGLACLAMFSCRYGLSVPDDPEGHYLW